MPRTPDAATWAPERLNRGYVAGYTPVSVVDGEGVRVALFVSGCPFRCEGCFNAPAQSFLHGEPYTPELGERILTDLGKPYIQGLTLLGGEPLLATPILLPLVREVRRRRPDKDVWCWTGYTFEWLLAHANPSQRELLSMVDVLVDGPFLLDQARAGLPFRGSANQRVLDLPRSLSTGVPTAWKPGTRAPEADAEGDRVLDLPRSLAEGCAVERVSGRGRTDDRGGAGSSRPIGVPVS